MRAVPLFPQRSAFAPMGDPNAALVAKMPAAAGASTPAVRRGMGGIFGGLTPERLQIIGAALRQLGSSPNALAETQDQLAQMRAQQEEANARAQEQAWQSQVRQRQLGQWGAQDRIGASLPEDQRDMFAADPGAALQQRGQRDQYAWQRSFDNENPEAITPYQRATLGLAAQRASATGGPEYQMVTAEEARGLGLAPGSYQRNVRTGQVTPIGRQRAQYTEFAGKSAQFASRMHAADQTLRELETQTDPVGVFAAMSGGGTPEQRRVRQAQREFLNAVLRQESGAAIGANEFQSGAQQYFPQPGDSPEVIEQKRQARQRAITGLINASQGAYTEWYGSDEEPPAAPEQPRTLPMGGRNGRTNSGVIRYDAQGRRIP